MQTSSAPSTRKGNSSQIIEYAALAAETARDLAEASRIPFLHTAAGASLLVLDEIQTMKRSQGMLLRITELIHQLLCVVIHICITEEGVLLVKTLGHLGQFAETLQNILTSLQFQQELGKIKRFIRQHEIEQQLRVYEGELQIILENLKMRNGIAMATALVEFELDAQQRHQELMSLIATENDGNLTEYSASFIHQSNSSSVFSLLPPVPKIFHGRDSELAHTMTNIHVAPAHVAILGSGGMGKTTLAAAALHHPEVISKYERRYFISCESAFEKGQFLNTIGAHLGLEPSKELSNAIITHFIEGGRIFLVLDNLETPWEQPECRAEVEDLLSSLSDLPQLTLLITMRGAERPPKIKWTRPFLPPLEPLPPSASRQTFIEIADDPRTDSEESDLMDLLVLSGHLPLAVNLLATVASYEGYAKTLLRWKTEKTSLLSDGYDKRSNLETSITISLSSPRILSSPDAKQLLSLLSLLPDGLADADLLSREAIDLPNILQCRTALLRTSLAYVEHGRLKALSPIREYMRLAHPPAPEAVENLRRHWDNLLVLWKSQRERPSGDLVARLRSNLANIDSVTQVALVRELSGADRQRLMRSILNLDLFSQGILKGKSPLAHHVVDHIQSSGDRRLHWERICSCLDLADYYSLPPAQAEVLIQEGIQYFEQEQDSSGQGAFIENQVEF
ncbi:P-loop containing nucleoside triphosphate hydrolase protein [Mycena latifolia]|nr:P-loop containing nucleoside triphosphate hydrolase protein [Mycena latifolia]